MSRFTETQVVLRELTYHSGRPILRGDRVQWTLAQSIVWEVGAEGSGVTIKAPAWDPTLFLDNERARWWDPKVVPPYVQAFASDLGSIPPFLRGFPGFSPDGAGVGAFLIHDVLYSTKGLGGVYTRKEADAILREALVALGVPKWRASVIHSAVRLGGSSGWGH